MRVRFNEISPHGSRYELREIEGLEDQQDFRLNGPASAVCTLTRKDGDKVALVGFGTFSAAERGERSGINPATKQAITIPAKKVVKFKAGNELESAIQ